MKTKILQIINSKIATYLFVFVCILLSVNVWFPRSIEISFKSDSKKTITYQVYYTINNNEWKETHSVKYKHNGPHVHITLPTKRIRKFRLDLGNNPGQIGINNITVSGIDTVNDFKESDFKIVNASAKFEAQNIIKVESNHADPYLICNRVLNLDGIRRINYLYLSLILFGSFYFLHIIREALNKRIYCSKNKSLSRLGNIEFLRLIFTLAIVVFHVSPAVHLETYGWQCVEAFFILSGYFLAFTYSKERNVLYDAWNRYIRFVPLVIVGGLLMNGGWQSFLAIFMIQGAFLPYEVVPNIAAWYIVVLFWCSLFFSALFRLLDRRKLIFVTSVLVFFLFTQTLTFKSELSPSWLSTVLGYPLLRGLSCMGLGVILCHFCPKVETKACRISVPYSIAEIIVLMYVIISIFTASHNSLTGWIYLPIVHGALLYLFLQQRGICSRLFSFPFFSKLSKYTLSIYLTHGAIQVTATQYFKDAFPGLIESNPYTYIICAVICSVFLGIIAYYIIEIPCIHLLRFFNRSQNI